MSSIKNKKAVLNNEYNFTKELILKEEIQSGSIGRHTFADFIKSIGGTLFLILIFIGKKAYFFLPIN